MQAQFFNEYAAYLALGFLLIYILAQLLVSKHPRFQAFTAIQKSVTVKVLALGGFVVCYIFFSVFFR
jgi:uncharacterized membrane protein (DUF485 family)